MGAVPRISVIIPARDAEATIGATLDGARRQDIAERVRGDRRRRRLHRRDRRPSPGAAPSARGSSPSPAPGPARPATAASPRASGELLAFTDADCVPAPDWLRRGSRRAGASRARPGRGSARPGRRADAVRPDASGSTATAALFETANLFCSRDLFDRLGGLRGLARDGGDRQAAGGGRVARVGAPGAPAPRSSSTRRSLVDHAVFRRGAAEYVAERLRLVHFPAIVGEGPRAPRRLLVARLFLSRRSAAFDARAARRRWRRSRRRSRLPLAARDPLRGDGRRRGAPLAPSGADRASPDVAADAVGAAALAAGSVRTGTAVL